MEILQHISLISLSCAQQRCWKSATLLRIPLTLPSWHVINTSALQQPYIPPLLLVPVQVFHSTSLSHCSSTVKVYTLISLLPAPFPGWRWQRTGRVTQGEQWYCSVHLHDSVRWSSAKRTNLVAFYKRVAVLMDKRRETDIIYLHLC